MTNAEAIDRQEFEAESRAILARALAYAKAKQEDERARIKGIPIPEVVPFKPLNRKPATLYEVDGVMASMAFWARRFDIEPRLVLQRMRNGMPIKKALTKPVQLINRGHRAVTDDRG